MDTTAVTTGANTSTTAQAAALQSALSATLADTTALATAINQNGGSVTNVATSVGVISSNADTIVIVAAAPSAAPEDGAGDTVGNLPVTKDEAILGLLVIIVAGGCICCICIVVVVVYMSKKNAG